MYIQAERMQINWQSGDNMKLTEKEKLNYDKAMDIVILGDVAKMFTPEELRTSIRLIITNAAHMNGHKVDEETKATIRIMEVDDGTNNLRLQARLKRGDDVC